MGRTQVLTDTEQMVDDYHKLCVERGSQLGKTAYEYGSKTVGHLPFRPAEHGWFSRISVELWWLDIVEFAKSRGRVWGEPERSMIMAEMYKRFGLTDNKNVLMRVGKGRKRGLRFPA